MNSNKVILDLFGGTGSWSADYLNAGYDVRLVTLPNNDVRTYKIPTDKKVYGILAAPPCTHYTNSGAQYWATKDRDGRTLDSLRDITTCLMIIAVAKPVFWAIENPVGRLNQYLGKPKMYFNPCDYGDPYTKKTCLWGVFNEPVKNPIEPEFVIAKNGDRYSPVHWNTGGSSIKTKTIRSITPKGFARAFFEANR